MTTLDALAERCGIEPRYVDTQGRVRETPAKTKKALLHAMGISLDAREEPAPLVDPATVVREGEAAVLRLRVPDSSAALAGRLTILLRSERGELRSVDVAKAKRVDAAVEIPIGVAGSPALPLGEYDVEASWWGEGATRAVGRLFVTPASCYMPEPVERGVFGLWVHLYALRGADDFGIGSLTDAAELASRSARDLGCGLLGLQPLHATPNRVPHDHSPYAPLSRVFRNPIYLDVVRLPEVASSSSAQALLRSSAVKREITKLRASPKVLYERVLALKLRILRAAFKDSAPPEPESALEDFATFEALRAHFRTGWPKWPRAYQDARSPAVATFRRTHAREVRFHAWLQRITERQLAETQESARKAGMSIGLYHDLAVGSTGSGAESWARPDLFVRGAETGAPPDAFNRRGQKWGVRPMDPRRMRGLGYAPFLELLRASMAHGGAVRLDHVMGLFRLWWVPEGRPATEGAYVRYPAADLLGLVALESHRARCVVVGEDLGTVPDGVRETLARERILGCRLVLFERTPEGKFLEPKNYPPLSVASFSSHDLPTLAGWWLGRDLALRKVRGAAERERERAALLAALGSKALPLDELIVKFHAWLGTARSRIVLAALDDLLGVEEQRNLPGTVDEYPNWRLRLAKSLPAILEDARLREAAAALRRARAR